MSMDDSTDVTELFQRATSSGDVMIRRRLLISHSQTFDATDVAMDLSAHVDEVVLSPVVTSPARTVDPGAAEEITIEQCVIKTVRRTENVSDPVKILRVFQRLVMQGRALEPSNDTNLRGKTLNISVSRYRVFDHVAEKILEDPEGLPNFRFQLEVFFFVWRTGICMGVPEKSYLI